MVDTRDPPPPPQLGSQLHERRVRPVAGQRLLLRGLAMPTSAHNVPSYWLIDLWCMNPLAYPLAQAGDSARAATPRLPRFPPDCADCPGTLGGDRTPNLLVRSQALYPLSYEGEGGAASPDLSGKESTTRVRAGISSCAVVMHLSALTSSSRGGYGRQDREHET
jgi:hypothetical protein